MILDTLDQAARYESIHPLFAAAFAVLRRPDLDQLAAGRHEIDGDRLYVMSIDAPGKGMGGTKLETHKRYIDIQFSLGAGDIIGWKSAAECRTSPDGYNSGKDVELFTDAPTTWMTVPAGTFAIYWPEDAHAPMAATHHIRKIVVKIAV